MTPQYRYFETHVGIWSIGRFFWHGPYGRVRVLWLKETK